jgi:hypothetical protein
MILVVILIIVVIIFIYGEYARISVYDDLLDGYWEAPASFCAKSDLKSAQMYINGDSVYILMEDVDGVLLNKCCGINKRPRWSSNIITEDVEYKLDFDESVEPLPKTSTMKVNLKNGLMGIFKSDTLMLELFKNNKLTSGVI